MNDDKQLEQSGQKALESNIAWYANALGLSHWRFRPQYGPEGCDVPGRMWMSDQYPNAIIQVRGNPDAPRDMEWDDWPEEESAVHEMLHASMRPIDDIVMKSMIPTLPKRSRRALDKIYDDARELFVETLSRALVAVAHADRTGPPPTIGAVTPIKVDEDATP